MCQSRQRGGCCARWRAARERCALAMRRASRARPRPCRVASSRLLPRAQPAAARKAIPRRCALRWYRTRARRGGPATAPLRPGSSSTARTLSPGPPRASPRSLRRRRRRNLGHTSPGRPCNRCVTASQKKARPRSLRVRARNVFFSSARALNSPLSSAPHPLGFRRARPRARHDRGGVRCRGAFGFRVRL